MKNAFVIAVIAVAVIPAVGAAQSVFDGTWKTEVNSIDFSAKPSVYVFRDGTYECKTCATKILVKTDGRDQKIEGNPYNDTLAVKLVDTHHVEMVGKKDGKVVARTKIAISTDGNSMVREYTNNSTVNNAVVKGTTSYARVAYDKTAPNLMSGSWKAMKADKRSDNSLLVSYRVEGDAVTMSTPTGESYLAKTNGTEAPFKGDPGITHVTLKLVKKNMLEETFKRDGKVVSTTRTEIDAGGKKAKVDWLDYLTKTNGNYVMMKQ